MLRGFIDRKSTGETGRFECDESILRKTSRNREFGRLFDPLEPEDYQLVSLNSSICDERERRRLESAYLDSRLRPVTFPPKSLSFIKCQSTAKLTSELG